MTAPMMDRLMKADNQNPALYGCSLSGIPGRHDPLRIPFRQAFRQLPHDPDLRLPVGNGPGQGAQLIDAGIEDQKPPEFLRYAVRKISVELPPGQSRGRGGGPDDRS